MPNSVWKVFDIFCNQKIWQYQQRLQHGLFSVKLKKIWQYQRIQFSQSCTFLSCNCHISQLYCVLYIGVRRLVAMNLVSHYSKSLLHTYKASHFSCWHYDIYKTKNANQRCKPCEAKHTQVLAHSKKLTCKLANGI